MRSVSEPRLIRNHPSSPHMVPDTRMHIEGSGMSEVSKEKMSRAGLVDKGVQGNACVA